MIRPTTAGEDQCQVLPSVMASTRQTCPALIPVAPTQSIVCEGRTGASGSIHHARASATTLRAVITQNTMRTLPFAWMTRDR